MKEGTSIRNIYRTISAGGTFGASPYERVIGLGKATNIQELSTAWPRTGALQKFTNLAVDKTYYITENENKMEEAAIHRFALKK